MIIILSPAKNLIAPDIKIDCSLTSTKPIFLEEAQELISLLRSKKVDDIAKMMHLSAPLAELNVSRYQQWSKKHTIKNARPSVLTFNGAAYLGLNASTFSEEELLFSQTHLRILSGLYGLLKPLDLMQDYRLEMGTSLSNAKGNNLYQFWDDKIVQALQKDVNKQGKVLINLASNEYSKAVPFKKLKARVIHFQFKGKAFLAHSIHLEILAICSS